MSHMNRIREHKAACERERRGRWWRDGLLGVCLGAFGGVISIFVHGYAWWTVPAPAVALGVLFAFCPPRTWRILAYLPIS